MHPEHSCQVSSDIAALRPDCRLARRSPRRKHPAAPAFPYSAASAAAFATAFATILSVGLSGCGIDPPREIGRDHLSRRDVAASSGPSAFPAPSPIPQPVQHSATLPRPSQTGRNETFSVVVSNVRAHDLLFTLARDARVNLDLHPGIEGTVSLNAIDQTLPQILARIARQIDMRFEFDGGTLVIVPDTPHLRSYRIDYVNMSRDASGNVAINTQIATTGNAAVGAAAQGAGAPLAATGSGNVSSTRVENVAKNRFWESLERNIRDILRETDKILPEGSSETVVEQSGAQSTTGTGAQPSAQRGGKGAAAAGASATLAASPNPAAMQSSGTTVIRRTTFREAASVIANPETGIVVVRATARQHEKIQEFVDQVMGAARRQVLIEATIAEVRLSQQYQQGIDWQRLRQGGGGISLRQGSAYTGITPPAGTPQSLFVLSYANPGSTVGNFEGSVRLLESFGTVKVLSSPKMSVLNNQTALLKVVDNLVYFTVRADTTTPGTGPAQTTVTTTPHSVSVGLVMSVTPQISDDDTVLLNIRPTISRVTAMRQDPNPNLRDAAGNVLKNEVPEIQTREMESMLRVGNGEVAVMGGLMQDGVDYRDDGVPGLARTPLVGPLFSWRNDSNSKTELVIFLRPVVIRGGSDYGDRLARLPGRDFFAVPHRPEARP